MAWRTDRIGLILPFKEQIFNSLNLSISLELTKIWLELGITELWLVYLAKKFESWVKEISGDEAGPQS